MIDPKKLVAMSMAGSLTKYEFSRRFIEAITEDNLDESMKLLDERHQAAIKELVDEFKDATEEEWNKPRRTFCISTTIPARTEEGRIAARKRREEAEAKQWADFRRGIELLKVNDDNRIRIN